LPVGDPPLSEGFRGEPIQRAVGSVGVVLDAPVLGQDLHLQQGVELFADQERIAEAAVERLADSVLPRRCRVDVGRVDAAVSAAVDQRVRGQFGAVVHADVLWASAQAGD
jgi:hypothetical protein